MDLRYFHLDHVGGQGGEIIPNAAKAIICTVGAARGGEAIQNDNKSDHLDNLGGQGCEIFKNGTKSDHLVRLGGQASEIIMTDTKNYHSVTAGVRLDATGRPNFCTIPYTPNNCQCFCFRFLNKLCSAGVGRQCFLLLVFEFNKSCTDGVGLDATGRHNLCTIPCTHDNFHVFDLVF